MLIQEEIWIIMARSLVTIVALFIVTKILGKKQLSQLTVYDYIIGITIGSIAADSVITLDENIIYGLVGILMIGLVGYGLSYIAIKSTKVNEILNGVPVILMENGNFKYDNLSKTMITIVKFMEQARLNGYYDISLLDSAILETDGKISFLPKEEYQNCNIKDFKSNIRTNVPKQTLCRNLIVDDEVCMDTLRYLGKDKEWLNKELRKNKVKVNEKVYLATIDETMKIKIYK